MRRRYANSHTEHTECMFMSPKTSNIVSHAEHLCVLVCHYIHSENFPIASVCYAFLLVSLLPLLYHSNLLFSGLLVSLSSLFVAPLSFPSLRSCLLNCVCQSSSLSFALSLSSIISSGRTPSLPCSYFASAHSSS